VIRALYGRDARTGGLIVDTVTTGRRSRARSQPLHVALRATAEVRRHITKHLCAGDIRELLEEEAK